MSISRTVAAAASALALSATCVVGAAGIAAPASAAPAAQSVHFTICHLRKHGGAYPPGKCFLNFNKGKYHRRNNLKFVSGKDFQPHEGLIVKLKCAGGYHKHRNLVHHFSYHHVGPKGRAHGHFKLTRHTPFGKCTVTVIGKTSGSKVRNSFTVTPKHHHHQG